jgi:hypothetical protein
VNAPNKLALASCAAAHYGLRSSRPPFRGCRWLDQMPNLIFGVDDSGSWTRRSCSTTTTARCGGTPTRARSERNGAFNTNGIAGATARRLVNYVYLFPTLSAQSHVQRRHHDHCHPPPACVLRSADSDRCTTTHHHHKPGSVGYISGARVPSRMHRAMPRAAAVVPRGGTDDDGPDADAHRHREQLTFRMLPAW